MLSAAVKFYVQTGLSHLVVTFLTRCLVSYLVRCVSMPFLNLNASVTLADKVEVFHWRGGLSVNHFLSVRHTKIPYDIR